MLIIFDKGRDPNILSIKSDNAIENDIYISNITSFIGFSVSFVRNSFYFGNDDIEVVFASTDSMLPYMKQIVTITGFVSPINNILRIDGLFGIVEKHQELQNTNIESTYIGA